MLAGARTLGVEEEHLSLARARRLQASGAELRDAGGGRHGPARAQGRRGARRDPRACAVVAEVIERMFAELRLGDVEREVNARVAFGLATAGATEAHPLILFGDERASRTATPGARRLAPGDVVCADVSARIDGYWGDLTRCGTVGPPCDWARRAWAVVRDAYAAAVAAARVGADAPRGRRRAAPIVEAAPDLGAGLHGAGHAIGPEIHEPPFLVPGARRAAAPGMC